MLRVAVLVKAEMLRGDLLQGEIFTVNVNAHGMTPDQRITLTNPQSGKQVACTVVRVEQPPQGLLFTIAFKFAERSPRFWPLPLPPLDWAVGQEPA